MNIDDDSNMNCDNYREAIDGEPSNETDGVRQHARDCAACSAYTDEVRTFDDKLLRAMSIPVPSLALPALPELDDNVVGLPSRRRIGRAPVWLGLAASIAVAGYFGLQFQTAADAPEYSLANDVIAHMDFEQASRIVTDVPVPERTLQNVVSKDVAEMGPEIGLITYAHSCVIHGKIVPHLVMQGENGPITLLLMPDEPIEAIIPLQGENVNGYIFPVNNGSIAVIGGNDQSLREIGDRVVDSVKWTT